jgi:hypothetical protein
MVRAVLRTSALAIAAPTKAHQDAYDEHQGEFRASGQV